MLSVRQEEHWTGSQEGQALASSYRVVGDGRMLGDSSHGSPLVLILLFISQATPPGLFAEHSAAIAMKICVTAGEH